MPSIYRGSIRANSVGMHDGRIVINGGGGNVSVTGHLAANGGRKHSGGTIQVTGASVAASGTLSANGTTGGNISLTSNGDVSLSGTIAVKGNTGQGGEIDLTGANVTILGALIDASGGSGGGTVNIGGGPHAGIALADAQSLSIDSTTTIRADALDIGNGGHIVVWSAGQTTVAGTLSATGGPNGGNGGLIETSGHVLNVADATVNASAANGAAGTWLLDPATITISAATATTIDNTLNTGTNGTNVVEQTTGGNAGTITLSTGVTLTWGKALHVDAGRRQWRDDHAIRYDQCK